MKKILPFYLYPYYFKIIGLLLGFAGLMLLLLLDPGFQLLFYFGLILIVFAKEKEESELVVKIRAESYKTVLGYWIALLIVLYLMEVIYTDFTFPCSPSLLIGVPLILYLIYFNLLQVVNAKKEDANQKGNTSGYLLWLLFAVVSTVVLALKFLG